MYILNGKKINIDAPCEVDGITYPNMRNPELRKQAGVIEQPDPTYPDPALYTWTENADGSLNITEKSADQVAIEQQQKINQESLAYLDSTDWYVIRATETGTLMPDDVKQKRQEARDSIVYPEDVVQPL